MDVFYQTFIIGVCFALLCLLFLANKVSYDVKLMMFLLLGYSFGGKGFAYISPFAPFYVSEVCLAVCLAFLLLRIRTFNFVTQHDGKRVWVLLIFMIAVSAFRLVFFDFPEYRMMAIRDSALAYYGLFFIMSFLAFERDANFSAVRRVLPWCCGLGLIASILVRFDVHTMLQQAVPLLGRVFIPHDDTTKPLVAALLLTSGIMFIRKKKLILVPVIILSAGILLLGQTSGVAALIFSFLFLTVVTRRREFLLLTVASGFMVIFSIGVIAISASSGGDSYIGKAHVETFRDIQDFDTSINNDNTTSWRLGWWTTIWEQTMDYSPLFGLGFGADITGEFQDLANVDAAARYPHNVAFTVIGRTGLTGILVFMTLISMILLHLYRGAKMILRFRELDYHFLLAITFVLAGIGNGFLQMTYEGPYAAIPHWIVLGYVFSYIRRHRQGRLEV